MEIKKFNEKRFVKTVRVFRILQVTVTALAILMFIQFVLMTFQDITIFTPLISIAFFVPFYHIILILFLVVNWTQDPFGRKGKISNSFLLVWLGFIGMWLWLPNKKKQQQLIRLNNTLV